MPPLRPFDRQDRLRLVAPFAAGGVVAFALAPLLELRRPLVVLALALAFAALMAAIAWLPWRRLPAWAYAVPAYAGLLILACGLVLSEDSTVFLPLALGPPLFLALYGTRRQLAGGVALAVLVLIATSLGMGRFAEGTLEVVAVSVIVAAVGALLFYVQHLVADLRLDRARERALLESLDEGVLYRDESGLRLANAAARRMLGITEDQLQGRTPHDLLAIRDDGSEWPPREWPMEVTARTGEPQVDQLMGLVGRDSTRWILVNTRAVGGQRGGVVASFADVTAERQAKEALERQATTDDLTGLANRRCFIEHAEPALARSRRNGHSLAILWIDLDSFKEINDDHGHAAGDEVLREVALRLDAETRRGDLLARYGGDEFALLMQNLHGSAEETDAAVDAVAERLAGRLIAPVAAGPDAVTISASFGAALFPRDADSLRALIDHADREMYRRKQAIRAEGPPDALRTA